MIDMTKEIWKEIPQSIYYLGFKPNYEVSNYGRVRNKKTGKILKETASNGNWNRPRIQFQRLSFQLSHLVYTAFIGDCYSKRVKHRDGDVFNNLVDNLYI